jgi:hypothetical protein
VSRIWTIKEYDGLFQFLGAQVRDDSWTARVLAGGEKNFDAQRTDRAYFFEKS